MRRISTLYKLAIAACFVMITQSCGKRVNGIDNNQIITKPYSLFVVDTFGRMDKTNDGAFYEYVKENGDNAGRAMIMSGSNIIWVMNSGAFVSVNNQNQFNPIKNYDANADQSLNQSMILDVPEHGRVYMAGNAGITALLYSDTNGKAGSWYPDNSFDPSAINAQITSLTRMANGTLAAFDYVNKRIFLKNGRNGIWKETTPITGLPSGGKFFISNLLNRLVLADSTGVNGVWYSDNNGASWSKYKGIPANATINCMTSVYNQVLLVGTSQFGIYKLPLNSDEFKPANNGLTNDAIIRNITPKYDYYKNNKVVQYVYLATNKGIFRSVDFGDNWILVKPGNYILIN